MAEDGRESKNGEGRLAERTQTSGANAPSPQNPNPPAEKGIWESPWDFAKLHYRSS
jgi:hypothetical protein